MSAPIQVQALATSLGNLTNLVRSQEKLLLELIDRQNLRMKGCEGAFREINERLDVICPYNIDTNNNSVNDVAPAVQDVVVEHQETFEEPQAVEDQIIQGMQHAGLKASIAEELAPPAPVAEPPATEASAAASLQHYDRNELLLVRGGNSQLLPVDAKDQETFRELQAQQQGPAPTARLYERQGQLAALAVPVPPTNEEPQQLVTSAVEGAWTAPQEAPIEQQAVQQPVRQADYRQPIEAREVPAPQCIQGQVAPLAVPVQHDPQSAPYSVTQPQRQEDGRQQQQQWNNGGAAPRGNGGPRGGGHQGGPRNAGSFSQAPQGGFAKPSIGGGGGFNANNKASAAPSNNNGNFFNAPAPNPSPGFANTGFGNSGGGFRGQPQQHRAAPRDSGFQQQQPAPQHNRPFAPSAAAPPQRGGGVSSYCVATRGRGPRNAFQE